MADDTKKPVVITTRFREPIRSHHHQQFAGITNLAYIFPNQLQCPTKTVMSQLNEVFTRSVETAVGQSMSQNKPLMVYVSATEADNGWIDRLLSPQTLQTIQDRAVCLRLVQGTPGFDMFQQFFAQLVVPSVYCIRASVIWDVLHGDLDMAGFDSRISAVVNGERHADAQTTPVVKPEPVAAEPVAERASQSAPPPTPHVLDRPAPSASASTVPAPTPAKKEYKSLKEQSAELASKKYKEEQLRRAQLAKEEKERVKRLLKADEEERKLWNKRKHEERERQRRFSSEEDDLDDEHCIDEIIFENKSLRDNIRRRAPSSSGDICALAIRLLDGSSIRHNFLATNTLNDVREWIDANRTDGDEPYCFHRTIPRTTFGVTDEERTLDVLELTPRSALILKPFATYTNAYTNTGSSSMKQGGLFSRLYSGLSSFWSSGGGPTPEAAQHQYSQTTETARYEPYRDAPANDASSVTTSQFASPVHSPVAYSSNPSGADLDQSHPSALNLNVSFGVSSDLIAPQRPLTPGSQSGQSTSRVHSPNPGPSRASSGQIPRIRTLNDAHAGDERTTYNGNHVNLEDEP